MGDDHIVAVEEVLLGSSCRRFQRGYNLCVIAFAIIECGLVLKNDQETSGNRLTGPDGFDEVVVVLLQFPALGISFTLHVPFDCIQVFSDIRFLGEYLNLDLHRTNLQPACKTVNDAFLLTHTAKQEVDGLHFKNLNVSAICQFHDAIANILHGD